MFRFHAAMAIQLACAHHATIMLHAVLHRLQLLPHLSGPLPHVVLSGLSELIAAFAYFSQALQAQTFHCIDDGNEPS